MASNAYLLYESQQEVGGHTFYKLRLDLVPEIYEYLIAALILLIDNGLPDELSLLDLPFHVPASIASGTELNNWSGAGSYTLPETIYFAYVKGQPHIQQNSQGGTPPGGDIAIAQAFLAESEVWYCDVDPGSLSQWPTGDDPTTNPPDDNGWSYPDQLADWGWVEDTDTAGRYLSPWFYTDVWMKNLHIWDGCDVSGDSDHWINNDIESFQGNRFRFADPNFIYSCNEEDSGHTYWIERETIGGVETISVWKFQANSPAKYYPHLDFSESIPTPSPISVVLPAMDLLNLLDIPLSDDILSGMRLTDVANLYAKRPERPRARSGGRPSGRSGSRPSGVLG